MGGISLLRRYSCVISSHACSCIDRGSSSAIPIRVGTRDATTPEIVDIAGYCRSSVPKYVCALGLSTSDPIAAATS
jgi:hypothetical protein